MLIGTTAVTERLRRRLVGSERRHASPDGHLGGLRKALRIEGEEAIVVCIALDQTTLARYGQALRTLVADLASFPNVVGCVGVLPSGRLTGELASMGCDVYATSLGEATRAIDAFEATIEGRTEHRLTRGGHRNRLERWF